MTTEPKIHCAYDKIVNLSELKPNPGNPNSHPENQLLALGKIIAEQGWRQNIKVSNRSGFIVSGHGRYEACRRRGFTKAPVDFQDYDSDESEWADLLADNRIAELAEIEDEKLAAILQDLKHANDLAADADKFDLTLSGFSSDQIDDIIESLSFDDPEVEEKLKESKPMEGSLLELLARAIGKTADDLAGFTFRVYGSNPGSWKVDLPKGQIIFKK